MERPPLSAFFGARTEDEFPVLNPSKGERREQSEKIQTSQDHFEEPEEKSQSFLGSLKDRALGVAKSIGSDIVSTGKMILEGRLPGTQIPRPLPGGEMSQTLPTDNPPSVPIFDKALTALEPSNETQEKWKKGTDWVTLLAPFAGKTITKLPGLAQRLEIESLRLTSAEKRDLGGKLERAANYLVEKGIVGNPSARLNKAEELYEVTEDRLQKFFSNEAKDVKIPREVYVQRLEALKGKYGDDRDSLAIAKQIDEAIATVKTNYASTPLIPIQNFNKWKRSVMKDAFNKAGNKVRDDVEFAIGDEANEMLKEYTKDLPIDGKTFSEFNKEYADLINARRLLYKAEDRDQVNMLGKLLTTGLFGGGGGAIGFMASGPLGGVVGGTAANYLGQKILPVVGGTAARSRLGQIYNSNLIKSLDPAAKKLLGFSLLYPSRLQETFEDDVKTDDLSSTMPQAPTAPRKEGRQPLESFIQ